MWKSLRGVPGFSDRGFADRQQGNCICMVTAITGFFSDKNKGNSLKSCFLAGQKSRLYFHDMCFIHRKERVLGLS